MTVNSFCAIIYTYTREKDIKMNFMYLVKSFGNEEYVNLKLFDTRKKAEDYLRLVQKQIPKKSKDEWVEIEEFVVQ